MFSTVRLATFNIRHGESRAGALDLGLLLRTCAEFNVDVLALQEVDKWMRRSQWANIAGRVARTTAMASAFGPALRRGWFGLYGNALLVRGRISEVQVVALPATGEPRAGLVARVETCGVAMSVAVTHLATAVEERDRQLSALLAVLVERPVPRLLCGDLNGPRDDVAGLVGAAGLRLVEGGPTFPAAAPTKQIDHVAVAGLDVVGAWVPDVDSSDHRPLVVELASA